MWVKDIMTQPAITCGPDTSIAVAGSLMAEHNCGVLPVVDTRRGLRLVGIVTDRDLLLAAASTNRNSKHVAVYEAMKHTVTTCKTDDTLETALETMRSKGVRRLPVIDSSRHVVGVLSIEDIVRWGVSDSGLAAPAVLGALDQICRRRATHEELTVSDS